MSHQCRYGCYWSRQARYSLCSEGAQHRKHHGYLSRALDGRLQNERREGLYCVGYIHLANVSECEDEDPLH